MKFAKPPQLLSARERNRYLRTFLTDEQVSIAEKVIRDGSVENLTETEKNVEFPPWAIDWVISALRLQGIKECAEQCRLDATAFQKCAREHLPE